MKKPGSLEREPGGGSRKIALYFSNNHVSSHEANLVLLVQATPEHPFEDKEVAKLRRDISSWNATALHLAKAGYPGIFPAFLRPLLVKEVA